MQPDKKLGKIAFVLDDRLPWDRAKALTQTMNVLRRDANMELLRAATTEEDLLAKMQAERYSLIMLPWHKYLDWLKLDALLGKNRGSGPTACGYFADAVDVSMLPPHPPQMQRAILIDIHRLHPLEVRKIVQALATDNRRTGIRPLLEPGSLIYCESWYANQGMGERSDVIESLPELKDSEWKQRLNSIRILLNCLWSMVYEYGPGKSDDSQLAGAKGVPRAYFQFGLDRSAIAFRIVFPQPNWKMIDLLESFWPGKAPFHHTYGLLQTHADLLRIQSVTNAPEIEVLAVLFQSRAAEQDPFKLHSLWIEPISPRLITERPFEAPGPQSPHLKQLPMVSQSDPKPQLLKDEISKVKDLFISDANSKMRDLQKLLAEKDELIRDLRMGGVSTAPALPPPDAEGLLEAFQEKYFEARFQIRQFENQILKIQQAENKDPDKIEELRIQMTQLIEREKQWIRFLAETLKIAREAKG